MWTLCHLFQVICLSRLSSSVFGRKEKKYEKKKERRRSSSRFSMNKTIGVWAWYCTEIERKKKNEWDETSSCFLFLFSSFSVVSRFFPVYRSFDYLAKELHNGELNVKIERPNLFFCRSSKNNKIQIGDGDETNNFECLARCCLPIKMIEIILMHLLIQYFNPLNLLKKSIFGLKSH